MAINKVIYNSEVLIDVTDCDITEADVAAGKRFIKKNGEKSVGTSTGGGGTSAVLGELNVSSNGTYEAGGAMTLVPGGIYQFKKQLPVETLAKLYSATSGNNGEIFSTIYQEMPLTQLAIHKTGDIYILESSVLLDYTKNIYATGATTFTYESVMSSDNVTVELSPGWNTLTPMNRPEVPALSTIRLPQDISGIPKEILDLVDLQFDTNNCAETVFDATTITVENLGDFVKLNNNFDLTKKLSTVSLSGFDEFNVPEDDRAFELLLMPLMLRNLMASNEWQSDIEGIKYLKTLIWTVQSGVAFMYVEDSSKIQVTSGTAENGCWYASLGIVFSTDFPWKFAYEKDLVDGYNKVTIDVPTRGALQSKTATSNGVYLPDEGFDGLSQVTVNFALQDKTVTANGTYTCDEGYDGFNQVTINVTPKLQTKTITENGTYTADNGYDGFSRVAVDVAADEESRTLLNNGKLAVHTIVGVDNLSLDPNKATIEELIINDGATEVSNGYNYANLKRVILPSTLKSIGGFAFKSCSQLASVTIPDSVTSIKDRAFQDCSGLANISIPNGVTTIGSFAFEYCSGLTSIIIPDGVTSINMSAFEGCTSLTSVTIGDSVTSIADRTFRECSSLTSIEIPNAVTSIGNEAFYNCSELTNVTIMSTTPPTLDASAFTGTALTQIAVPAGCGEAYRTAENWSNYAEYIIEMENGMHRVTLGEEVTGSIDGTSYSNQTFDVADQTVIHFEVGQSSEGGEAVATPDGIFLNGVLVSDNSGPATYDLTVTGNVSVAYSTGDVVDDITYNNCYKIVMN